MKVQAVQRYACFGELEMGSLTSEHVFLYNQHCEWWLSAKLTQKTCLFALLHTCGTTMNIMRNFPTE